GAGAAGRKGARASVGEAGSRATGEGSPDFVRGLGHSFVAAARADRWVRAGLTMDRRDVKMSRSVVFLTRTAVLLALTLAIQMAGMPQYATGPLVNTMLYIAATFVGIGSGVAIGVVTPVIAFWRGILPPPLGPMIPFIAIGNAVLVIVFGLLERRGRLAAIVGIAAASVLKFLVLSGAVRFVVQVKPAIANMMQTPQLVTALAGGAIAFVVSEALLRTGAVKRLSDLGKRGAR
ncbi:MAG: hypothetical protein ACM3X3_01175, partial [Betaproteobacteria bacterium]